MTGEIFTPSSTPSGPSWKTKNRSQLPSTGNNLQRLSERAGAKETATCGDWKCPRRPLVRQARARSSMETLSALFTWLTLRDTDVTKDPSVFFTLPGSARKCSWTGILTGRGLAKCPTVFSKPAGRPPNDTASEWSLSSVAPVWIWSNSPTSETEALNHDVEKRELRHCSSWAQS